MRSVRFEILIYTLVILSVVSCRLQNIQPSEPLQRKQFPPDIPPESHIQTTPEMVEEYALIHQISDPKTAEFYLTHPDYAKKHPYKPTAKDVAFYEGKFLERTYPGFKELADEKGFMSARGRYMNNPVEGTRIGSKGYTRMMLRLAETGGRMATTGEKNVLMEDDSTSAAYNEGMKLYREKRLDDAIVQMEIAVQIKPDAPTFLYDLGVIYMDKGDHNKAISYFLKSIEQIRSTGYTNVNLRVYSGVYMDACTNLGLIYTRLERYEEAIKVLKEAIQFRPDDLNANWNLGFAYWSMGDMEKATAQMRKYTKLDPKNAEAHNIIGLTHYCNEFYEAALEEFQTAAKLDPEEHQYSYNEALSLARLDRYEEVERALERASGWEQGEYLRQVYQERIRINRANKLYNEGCAAMKDRRLTQAIDYFNGALELMPDMVGAHVNLGVCYRMKEDIENQMHHFQEAARLKPDMPDVHYNLGLAYSKAKMYSKAIIELKQAIQLRPFSKDAHFNLGTALYKTGNYAEAAKEFRECLGMFPKWFEARLNLGSCYLKTENVDGAIEHFEKAVQIKPDSAEAYYSLGIAYMRAQKLDTASALFHKALELDPAHRKSRIMLREIEMYQDK